MVTVVGLGIAVGRQTSPDGDPLLTEFFKSSQFHQSNAGVISTQPSSGWPNSTVLRDNFSAAKSTRPNQ